MSTSTLLAGDEKIRLHRFVIGTAITAVLLAAITTLAVGVLAPDGGWTVALGVGAMTGFWMCPLGGAVIGNGYHELMADRAKAAAES